MVGKGNHHADFGIGVTGVSRRIIAPDLTGQLRKNLVIAVPRLSYRYQKASWRVDGARWFYPDY